MSINRVTISGNLTRDPELKTVGSGTTLLNFGVAVNDRRKNQQTGEWEDVPNFFDCTVFGAHATALSKFLRKGMKVAVDGRLHYSSWEKDGQKHSRVSINVDEIDVMSRNGQGTSGQQAAAKPQPAAQADAPEPDAPYDEDIPF